MASSGLQLLLWPSNIICGCTWPVICVFVIYRVKFVRQRRASSRCIALLRLAVPKQSILPLKKLLKELLGYHTSQTKDVQ